MEVSTARAALDLVADAVVILRQDMTLIHANRVAHDVLGAAQDWRGIDAPNGLKSWTDPKTGSSLAEIAARGRVWRGTLVLRSDAATDRFADVTFAPIDTATGDDARFVVVVRDPIGSRTQSEHALREADRAAVLMVMHDVRPQTTVEATSMSLCHAVARIDGIDGAMVLVIPPKGELVHVSNVGPEIPGFKYGARIPVENIEIVTAMTEAGPWWLDLQDPATRDLVGGDLVDSMLRQGITATGYAGIRHENTLTGVLCVCSTSFEGRTVIPRRLESLEQIGAFAGIVLANQAASFGRDEALRAELRDVIDNARFMTFVQPIVNLVTGERVGYEALTRFDDGARPDLRIADAHAVGLGMQLEEACAVKALASMRDIDTDLWLAINFSPVAVVGGSVERVLASPQRHLVVEITEHSVIDNYDQLRLAMSQHPDVDVSIDDAGAGFASLRHILELAPAFVKLDIGMVRDVDSDPSRAAMVAGMCHFASVTGTRLVAEGIETAQEAATLRELGVELGQGYFFEPPGPPKR